MIIADEL